MGGKVIIGSDKLPSGKAGGFDWSTGTIYLPEDVSLVTLQHELYHFEQWKTLGTDAYVALRQATREIYVGKRLAGLGLHWTEDELKLILKQLNDWK